MIVRQFGKCEQSNRRIVTKNWESTRMLLKNDGMGFSFHITTIYPGTSTHMWYQNHLESVYCIEGTGRIEEVASGKSHDIEPGTLYALNEHDEHVLHAETRLVLACVFNPPLLGTEVHNEDGVYPLEAQEITD
jgi:L-ectoine synthase